MPFTVIALDHVQVAIPPGDEAKARAFYADTLGMRELEKPPTLATRGGCWFQSGGAVLHCGVEEPFTPARKAHPALIVTDLDACMGALQAAGHAVQPDVSLPDRRRVYVTDPFGNRIELMQMGDGLLQRPHLPHLPPLPHTAATSTVDAPPPRIDQAITFLYTTDIGPMAHFYETVIGLPLVLDQGGCRIYRVAGEAFLGVCERPQPRDAGGVIVTFVADDVDAWADRLRAHGVALEREPAYNPDYRIHHLFARDPGGYLVEIQRFEDERWPRRVE